MCTLEELDKIQKKDMFLQQKLYQSDRNNHEEHEQKIQLEDKEGDKRLKTEVADLTKEMEESNTHDNKIKEVLEETK